jgi:hypothetical protein
MSGVRRRLSLVLLATIVAGAGCAPMEPREGGPPRHGPPPSAATPADLQQVESIREVMDGQGRALDAEHAQAAPDCSRIRLLGRNICTLAEHICAIAARYPAGDPIAESCADGRGRCVRAKEIVQERCAAPTPTE